MPSEMAALSRHGITREPSHVGISKKASIVVAYTKKPIEIRTTDD